MSGGRATVALKSGTVLGAQAGDVSAISALGENLLNHVVIECKSYQDLDVLSGIVNDAGKLYRFWAELQKHSAKFKKLPMLIARQNNVPTICLLPPAALPMLFGLVTDHAVAQLPRWDCVVILFECFLREARVPGAALQLVPTRRRVVL